MSVGKNNVGPVVITGKRAIKELGEDEAYLRGVTLICRYPLRNSVCIIRLETEHLVSKLYLYAERCLRKTPDTE